MDNIDIWDIGNLQVTKTLSEASSTLQNVAWSSDKTKLASASMDMTAKIWDVQTGKRLATYKHDDVVFSVAWSPNGEILATACANGLVYLWKAP